MISDERFSEEVAALGKIAFGVAYLILKNPTDCEDAMGAAILAAYAHRRNLRKGDSFRAWFLRILRNEAYAILRAQKRMEPADELPEMPQGMPDPAERLDLCAALERLPEGHRTALLLQQEGYTLEEISQICRIPVGTVKSRLSRAKEMLRTCLEVQ